MLIAWLFTQCTRQGHREYTASDSTDCATRALVKFVTRSRYSATMQEPFWFFLSYPQNDESPWYKRVSRIRHLLPQSIWNVVTLPLLLSSDIRTS
ncbi:hypothetical protein BC628DRAFT_136748 [Trametes gibbosa]|nr:hypothetical protein BC628DRAFT_136748 [Trametes gibbosa]